MDVGAVSVQTGVKERASVPGTGSHLAIHQGVASADPSVSVGEVLPSQVGIDFASLQSRWDEMARIAAGLRAQSPKPSDASFLVRKLYPPYPPEQRARMSVWQSVSGLTAVDTSLDPSRTAVPQDQIDSLAVHIGHLIQQDLADSTAITGLTRNRGHLQAIGQDVFNS